MSYSYETLKAAAIDADVWIDVQDKKTFRGRGCGNTNKKERVSRALSWYARSETDNEDERLIFAYIAFEALCSQGGGDEYSARNNSSSSGKEKTAREEFLSKLAQGKYRDEIFNFALDEVKNMQDILSFQYISYTYWHTNLKNRDMYENIKKQKDRVKKKTRQQIMDKDIYPIKEVIKRVNLLRNQILHGMAAYGDSYNRQQVALCANFLNLLVGCLIKIVIDSDVQQWGKVPYPPQGMPNEPRLEVEELED